MIFKGISKEEQQTSHEIISVGDTVTGTLTKEDGKAYITDKYSAECGGVGSGLVELKIEVEKFPLELV